jgi:cytochrome c5
MSEQQHDFPKTTPAQFLISLLGGLFAPALVIFLVVKLLLGIQASHLEDSNAVNASARIEERIKPVAEVVVADNSGPHVDRGGEQVVQAVCAACHGSGVLGSPKIGDKAAWGPRIAQGYETLIKHAIEGIRQMPARGGGADLSDNEVAAAIAYMANQSGAKFKAPEPAAAPAAEAPPTADAKATASVAAPAAKAAAKVESPAKSEAVAAKSEEPAKPAPVAEAAAKPTASAGKGGEEVVKAVCSVCHGAGVLGSPKMGDQAAWAPRIAQGYETLVQNAIKGIRMMPAKGGNPALTDAEVAGAVAYMANQSGANFTAPAH